ncbi:hypothetical protein SPSIL_039150 [Sporomusa silvacetica DSM 10669]|uniref:Thermophilic metalloprotease (M29) n=1 Tax=Sporomusa silvacetica DSM 10669 TaxID=1123289 RepID=A0ABZ3IQ78_9FIRM|nr:aminopeptidase [Sporomusa silvacetica]OZC13820.1 thermophilic metalloprotease [Sporomusa silvacetica DSM 10669]
MSILQQNLINSLNEGGPVTGVVVCYQSERELAHAIAQLLPYPAYVVNARTTSFEKQEWYDVVSHVIEVYEPDKPGYEKCKLERIGMLQRGCRILSLFDWQKSYLADAFWGKTNYRELALQLTQIKKALEGVDTIHITSALGTDISFGVTGRQWIAADGICSSNHLAQMPDGEIYTCPIEESFNGVLVIDGTITRSWLPAEPQRLVFEQGRLSECSPEFRKYIAPFEPEINLIGEFALGLNPAYRQNMHNISVDEKAAGTVHFALGDSYNLGINQCNCHVDMIICHPRVSTFPAIELPYF